MICLTFLVKAGLALIGSSNLPHPACPIPCPLTLPLNPHLPLGESHFVTYRQGSISGLQRSLPGRCILLPYPCGPPPLPPSKRGPDKPQKHLSASGTWPSALLSRGTGCSTCYSPCLQVSQAVNAWREMPTAAEAAASSSGDARPSQDIRRTVGMSGISRTCYLVCACARWA